MIAFLLISRTTHSWCCVLSYVKHDTCLDSCLTTVCAYVFPSEIIMVSLATWEAALFGGKEVFTWSYNECNTFVYTTFHIYYALQPTQHMYRPLSILFTSSPASPLLSIFHLSLFLWGNLCLSIHHHGYSVTVSPCVSNNSTNSANTNQPKPQLVQSPRYESA